MSDKPRLTNFTEADVQASLYEHMMRTEIKAQYKRGGSPVVKCKECGTSFPYSPKGRWRDFCGAKCRVYYNRSKKKNATSN